MRLNKFWRCVLRLYCLKYNLSKYEHLSDADKAFKFLIDSKGFWDFILRLSVVNRTKNNESFRFAYHWMKDKVKYEKEDQRFRTCDD